MRQFPIALKNYYPQIKIHFTSRPFIHNLHYWRLAESTLNLKTPIIIFLLNKISHNFNKFY